MIRKKKFLVGGDKMQESGEMYLETIHILRSRKKDIRAIDVGEHMGYSKPSVSRALSILKNGGYVVVDEHGFLSLTETGQEIAEKIYARHNILTKFLNYIGVEENVAKGDACKMEHVISDETYEALESYMQEK